jgi:hypothetical protein
MKDKYLPNGITGAYSYNPNGDISTIAYTSVSTNVLNPKNAIRKFVCSFNPAIHRISITFLF